MGLAVWTLGAQYLHLFCLSLLFFSLFVKYLFEYCFLPISLKPLLGEALVVHCTNGVTTVRVRVHIACYDENVHACNTSCAHLWGHPHGLCSARSIGKLGFNMVLMRQHCRKTVVSVMTDIVLSATLWKLQHFIYRPWKNLLIIHYYQRVRLWIFEMK